MSYELLPSVAVRPSPDLTLGISITQKLHLHSRRRLPD